ncbi:testis-specific serine/threonine-protein kinase 1-like [Ylistrum balloti]|uniref:testis-specific serine/threonine-protein kinase 1-like n=1 Tax=Ylistrum balloti TaxID=509963 RepID=UPI002905B71C|nr:testis-specific serine/threonine-protein kinase 1-like [Ylistrum balloti]
MSSSGDEVAELKKSGYALGALLGEGSYAKVKSAYSSKINARVAVKIINKKKAPKDFREKFLPRELDIIQVVDHPNVVKLYEIIEFNGKVFIMMEYAGHGDLLEYIKLRGALQEDRAQVMFTQIVNAMTYLHERKIVHRDMKCENLLLDCMNNIKISDFGFARCFEPSDVSKTFCGSAAYAAPEVLQGIPYHLPSHDVWSMGIILYIMVCASMPYDDSNIKKMVSQQLEKRIGFSKGKKLSVNVKDLIYKLLEVNVKKRPNVFAIKDHPFILSAQTDNSECDKNQQAINGSDRQEG